MIRVLVLDQAVGLWGAQAYLLRLAAPMSQRGYHLVLGSPGDLDLACAWRAAGHEHVEIDLPVARSVRATGDGGRPSPAPMLREARRTLHTAGLIAAAARAASCTVLHANGHGVHLEAALAGRRSRLPTVLYLHEEMPQHFGAAVRAAAVALAPASIAVSAAVARGVPRALRSRVTAVPNGVDVQALTPGPADPAVRESLGAAPGDVLLLALTRLDPVKRIEDLLTAVAPMAQRPGWHLAVAGETSSFPEYEARVLAQARDLGGRVSFVGRREDVPAMLRAADVVVHAGVVEGMPLGLVEAAACGRPVVAYRVAGVPEVVVEGATGLLATAPDAAELGRHIARLVADPDLRATMGAAARARAVAEHGLDRQSDRCAAVLDRLLAEGPRVHP